MPPSHGVLALQSVLHGGGIVRFCRPGGLLLTRASVLSTPAGARVRHNMSTRTDYNDWSKPNLIEKVQQLENELRKRHTTPPPDPQTQQQTQDGGAPDSTPLPNAGKKPKVRRKMDPSKYTTRYIALKLAYLGKNYGGFEFQATANQPSIEEELWKALTKACLIFPTEGSAVDYECCEYSKCGRTDRGVSAFGQVIGLRVRSNRPLPKQRVKTETRVDGEAAGEKAQSTAAGETEDSSEMMPFDHINDELPYPRILNRLLPPDIRILAWCPSPPPDFSARFSCRERQYRYFFTQPAFSPVPSSLALPSGSPGTAAVQSGWLDLEAMRDAARRFEGEHDFRNVCKIDAAKQITNFVRTIFEASIEEVPGASSSLPYLNNAAFSSGDSENRNSSLPKVYSFNVRGSAFLWHQIRHMVSILFLVGQGLEPPSIVDKLLNVRANPCKPKYAMADEVPLVLWDCIFPEEGDRSRRDALQWLSVGDVSPSGKAGPLGLIEGVWETWRERKMDELLANQLLRHISRPDDLSQIESSGQGKVHNSTRLFEGGNGGRNAGKYVPVMKREKMESLEEQNEKYARRKGYASAEDMRTQRGS